MLTFLQTLATTGRVVVAPVPPTTIDALSLEAAIASMGESARAELASEVPSLRVEVAVWALAVLEASCRFLVHREYDADAIARVLGRAPPAVPDAAVCYSADLLFRHLPDVHRLARGLSADDPLVAHLSALGRRWPLSSVGMPGLTDVDVTPFIDHPALRQLYVDRIIERSDVGRLGDAAVRQAVAAALGDHGAALAPAMAAALVRTVGD